MTRKQFWFTFFALVAVSSIPALCIAWEYAGTLTFLPIAAAYAMMSRRVTSTEGGHMLVSYRISKPLPDVRKWYDAFLAASFATTAVQIAWAVVTHGSQRSEHVICALLAFLIGGLTGCPRDE